MTFVTAFVVFTLSLCRTNGPTDMENKIEDFFLAGNAVSGEPDYGLAETFVRTAEAFATSVCIVNVYNSSNLI